MPDQLNEKEHEGYEVTLDVHDSLPVFIRACNLNLNWRLLKDPKKDLNLVHQIESNTNLIFDSQTILWINAFSPQAQHPKSALKFTKRLLGSEKNILPHLLQSPVDTF